MLRSQSRSHRSHCIHMPSSIGSNNIHEPFHQINLMCLLYHWFSLIQVVKFVGLIENTGSSCIFILGLSLLYIFLSPKRPEKPIVFPNSFLSGNMIRFLKVSKMRLLSERLKRPDSVSTLRHIFLKLTGRDNLVRQGIGQSERP